MANGKWSTQFTERLDSLPKTRNMFFPGTQHHYRQQDQAHSIDSGARSEKVHLDDLLWCEHVAEQRLGQGPCCSALPLRGGDGVGGAPTRCGHKITDSPIAARPLSRLVGSVCCDFTGTFIKRSYYKASSIVVADAALAVADAVVAAGPVLSVGQSVVGEAEVVSGSVKAEF